MPVGVQNVEPDRLAGLCCEHRSLRIASNLCVSQDVGEVERVCHVELSFRSISHALPKRLSAIVNRFLCRVFSIFSSFRTAKIWHRSAVSEPHVDIRLELKYELTERRAIRLGNRRLRARSHVLNPRRALRFDDKRTNRA